MANIQLYVENQLCDYDDKTFFSLQKEFSDEKELVVKEIEYSYTISIPTSPRNRRIFGYVDEFDVPNKFSRVFNAELYVDEILILKGKLKLNSIDDKYFKGNLYNPALATVSDVLGDRMLNKIQPHMKLMNNLWDYSATNHYVSGYGVQYEELPDKYKDLHICFPYILYGLPMNLVDNVIEQGLDFYTQDLEYGKHNISTDNIFPAFNVLSVLKDMFETEGYKLQGNVFDNDKFKYLYQTFQGNYTDYIDKKETPLYLSFSCKYSNYHVGDTPIYDEGVPFFPRYVDKVSRTLSTENIWTEEGFDTETLTVKDDGDFDGTYKAGVDNPLLSDLSTITIKKDEQHMMSEGTESGSKTIMIPKSGWYKIHCDGTMNYPMRGSSSHSSGWPMDNRPERNIDFYQLDGRESIGVCIDEADYTTLKEQPFEFQIKKGYAKSNPNLYSFNSGIPCMPRTYSQFTTTKSYNRINGADKEMYIKVDDRDSTKYYGKNGKQTLIKNYSDFDSTDLLIGARLGGAAFDCGFQHAYYDDAQRHNRFAFKGALLALPRADRSLPIRNIDDELYFRIAERDRDVSEYYVANEKYEYATDTAQILIRADDALTNFKCFSNFDGYNKLLSNYHWDTTTNYNARTFPTDDTNSKYYANTASTRSEYTGDWNMNTVIWLEKGEYINIEVIMPWHDGGRYYCCHSKWTNRHDWVNATEVNFNFEIGLVSTDKNWYPTDSMRIPTFENLSAKKETNVNQFLPNVKCNDYLNNFLQTFNLQLTHPSTNVFSIDYSMNNDVIGKIIDLDIYANKNDAEFKALDIPSTRQLAFKVDKNETGYADGNQSPYKTENAPWYLSGYTGSLTLTNEANTSGKIDKKESNWSYCWYKTIKFLHDQMYDHLHPSSTKVFDVPVIANKSVWSDESSYGAQDGANPSTSSTMRLFLVKRVTNTESHRLIRFKYDRRNPNLSWQTNDYKCTLIIPTNFIPAGGQKKNYILDYDITNSGGKATITDTFFRIQVQSGYEINVPVKLPNDVYRRINSGTLIKFNDGLYKVSKIEGHDVKEQDYATITLITLT